MSELLDEMKKSVPKRIREIRKLHRLSMGKFAAAIGVSPGNVNDWDKGKNLPSLSAVIAISQKFKVSLDWLLTGKETITEIMEGTIFWTITSALNSMNKQEQDELLRYAAYILNRNEHQSPQELLEQAIDKRKFGSLEPPELTEVKETHAQYIPVVGRAAAGVPITAIPFVEGYIPVDRQYKDCFAVRVKGDSMVDAGIMDGGFVVVRRQPTVENGEIALVMIDDEVTIKKFVLENGRGSLISANHKYKPIYVDSRNDVKILGKVVKVFTYEEIKDEIKEDLSFLSQQ